ncbi:MAG: hypothetical protein ACYDH2_17140 [Anaerolineaceae bacterium]
MTTFNKLSKKIKLPKEFWKRGKSKFLFTRMAEEKVLSFNGLIRKYDYKYYSEKFVRSYKVFKKIFVWIKQRLCNHIFETEETTTGLIMHCPNCDYSKFVWKR